MSPDAGRGTLNRVVLAIAVGGAAAILIATIIGSVLDMGSVPQVTTGEIFAFIALGALAELVYVPIKRGESWEDLTFVEVAFAAGLLALPMPLAILLPLTGIAVAQLVLRVGWSKGLFNVGSSAISAAAMALIYMGAAGGDPFSGRGVIALVLATVVFAGVNLLTMARILWAAEGTDPSTTIAAEWRLSGFMGISCAGVALVAVSVAQEHAALLPFTSLPVFALFYAYRSAAKHAREHSRSTWLLELGESLAEVSAGRDATAEALEAIRGILNAPYAQVVSPDGRILASAGDGFDIHPADDHVMDVGELGTGFLRIAHASTPPVVGVAQHLPWTKRDRTDDESILNTLIPALSSALRSGRSVRALAAETAKLSAVVNHASDGIAVISDTGEILLWSPALTVMTGIPTSVATNRRGSRRDTPAPLNLLVDELNEPANWIKPGQASFGLQFMREDDLRDLDVSAVRTTASGSGVWVLTVRDLTRERRVERLKADFVATISHELRTPITPIRGYARLLATRGDRLDPARRQAALEMMADRAEHLTRLVDDLLLASRVAEGSRLAIESADVPLTDIVTQAVASFPGLSPRLTTHMPTDLVAVRCDRVRAVQCLSNLLGNAEKYTPADAEVRVIVTVNEGMVSMAVADSGPGIPESEQARVFDRFYRIQDPFTAHTGGAGLGLHIARELATAMGGGLTLESAPGRGATFTLSLPKSTRPLAGAAPRVAHAWLPYEAGGTAKSAPAGSS